MKYLPFLKSHKQKHNFKLLYLFAFTTRWYCSSVYFQRPISWFGYFILKSGKKRKKLTWKFLQITFVKNKSLVKDLLCMSTSTGVIFVYLTVCLCICKGCNPWRIHHRNFTLILLHWIKRDDEGTYVLVADWSRKDLRSRFQVILVFSCSAMCLCSLSSLFLYSPSSSSILSVASILECQNKWTYKELNCLTTADKCINVSVPLFLILASQYFLNSTHLSGIYIAFPWAFPGIAHFFCLLGGSLSGPAFSCPPANTMQFSFYKFKS